MQARKYVGKGFTLALKPRTDVTRSPKQGYQWPHKKGLVSSKKKKKLKKHSQVPSMILGESKTEAENYPVDQWDNFKNIDDNEADQSALLRNARQVPSSAILKTIDGDDVHQ